MKKFTGRTVYRGIVSGPAVVLKNKAAHVKQYRIDDVEAEIARIEDARNKAKKQLKELYERAHAELGEASAAIFEVHQMLLEEEDYRASIYNMIRTEKVNAEYAVVATGDNFAAIFSCMDDDYMRARAADIKDISNRLLSGLSEEEELDFETMEPSIIITDDLSPSETVQMDKRKVLAFVTVHGSVNSHTAILARIMNIPAIIGVQMNLEELQTGAKVIVDGFKGEVIFDPTDKQCRKAEAKLHEEEEKKQLMKTLRGKETVTLSGKKIKLYANISNTADIGYALENDAEGIGLFRSEFLYLGRNDFPTENEQYQAYRQAAQMMAGKQVVIRTLDIGADKQAEYFNLGDEENPALGYRAIRICLKEPDIFKKQLRAIFRAAVHGNISVMYPMITSVEEVERIFEIIEDVKAELDKESIPYQIPPQGVMIETSAAVMVSDELAEMVDFFSIGTNDLIQYTLAVDRLNEKVEDFYRPHHKAILKMVRMVIENAHKCGKWVSICGELGADLELTEEFVKMGVDEVSAAPSMLLKIRKRIREIE